MMKKLRGLFRIIFGRTAFVILFMAIQLGILFGVFRWLEDYVHIIYVVSILLSAVVIIYIFNEPINSSFISLSRCSFRPSFWPGVLRTP